MNRKVLDMRLDALDHQVEVITQVMVDLQTKVYELQNYQANIDIKLMGIDLRPPESQPVSAATIQAILEMKEMMDEEASSEVQS